MRSVDLPTLEALEAKVLAAFEEAVRIENAHWPKADEAHQLKLVKTQIGNRPAGMRPADCPAVQAALGALDALGIEARHVKCSPPTPTSRCPSTSRPSALARAARPFLEHSLKEYFDSTDMHPGPQLAHAALAMVGRKGERGLFAA